MRAVLIPVDGADAAPVRAVIAQAQREPVAAIHVLNVQPAMGAYVRHFIDRDTIGEFQREQGEAALATARRLLDAAGLPYRAHLRIGPSAPVIARTAAEFRVDEIVMGCEGGGVLGMLMLWCAVAAVRRHARVPVVVVMNPRPATRLDLPLERWRSTYSR